MLLILALCLILISTISECANILCFAPITSFSHQQMPRMLMKKLAERGHNVTFFTTDPFESDQPNLVQHSWHYTYELYKTKINVAELREKNTNVVAMNWKLNNIAMDAMKLQLQHPEITELIIGNYTFDLVVVEAAGLTPFYAFGRHFNAPLVGYTTLDSPSFSHEAVGNHIHPIIHPDRNQLGLSNSSFIQRIYVIFVELLLLLCHVPNIFDNHQLLDQYFGPEMARPVELALDLDFLIYSNHPVFGSIRPSSPASLAVGFMHIEETKPLTGNLAKYFQHTNKEVIYFSLGSNVRSADLSKQVVETFFEVFRKMDYEILWKWEALEPDNKPDNVKFVKWLPQQDILGEKLFHYR
jgi:glucuronosyltransferase